jgi:hypothetical protein
MLLPVLIRSESGLSHVRRLLLSDLQVAFDGRPCIVNGCVTRSEGLFDRNTMPIGPTKLDIQATNSPYAAETKMGPPCPVYTSSQFRGKREAFVWLSGGKGWIAES